MNRTINQALVKNISNDFIQHAKDTFLNGESVDEFLSACCTPLRKSIRINTLKISVKKFENEILPIFNSVGLNLIPIPWCQEGFWLEPKVQEPKVQEPEVKRPETQEPADIQKKCKISDEILLGNFPSHIQGLFYIQEASSMLPPLALLNDYDAESTNKTMLLDLAAAPGSKTTQMAALLNNNGLILANELSASRVKVLYANLVRCGVSNTCMSQFDGRKLGDRLSSLFDFVLLDAPCGGEGTIRKDNNALKNWQLSKVEEIAKLQKELILTAYQCLKPGGKLVYSTCTLSFEENQQVAYYLTEETNAEVINLDTLFQGAEKSSTKEGFLHVLPHIYDSEGFFIAAFRKPLDSKEVFYSDSDGKKVDNHLFSKLNKKVTGQLLQYYSSHFGLDISSFVHRLKQRDKEIWLFPENINEVNSVVRLNRSGIKVAELYPNKVRSTHEFIVSFEQKMKQQKIEISLAQAEDFYKGRNLDLGECSNEENYKVKDGEVILTLNQQVIGFGGLRKNKIKNQLPRDLVRDQIKFFD